MGTTETTEDCKKCNFKKYSCFYSSNNIKCDEFNDDSIIFKLMETMEIVLELGNTGEDMREAKKIITETLKNL